MQKKIIIFVKKTMSLIKWNDSLVLNIPEIDEQHKQLIDIINELFSAMQQGKANEIIDKIIDRLVAYTQVHFKTEEKYFDKFSFKNSAKHRLEHLDFIKKVNEFKLGLKSNKIITSIDVMKFISHWINNHIQMSDKEYVECFKSNGL